MFLMHALPPLSRFWPQAAAPAPLLPRSCAVGFRQKKTLNIHVQWLKNWWLAA
jgi:hypothetical protein